MSPPASRTTKDWNELAHACGRGLPFDKWLEQEIYNGNGSDDDEEMPHLLPRTNDWNDLARLEQDVYGTAHQSNKLDWLLSLLIFTPINIIGFIVTVAIVVGYRFVHCIAMVVVSFMELILSILVFIVVRPAKSLLDSALHQFVFCPRPKVYGRRHLPPLQNLFRVLQFGIIPVSANGVDGTAGNASSQSASGPKTPAKADDAGEPETPAKADKARLKAKHKIVFDKAAFGIDPDGLVNGEEPDISKTSISLSKTKWHEIIHVLTNWGSTDTRYPSAPTSGSQRA